MASAAVGTGLANYDIQYVDGTLSVVFQITPVITWANPASITFGTALSATQLNATANVPGTFVYTPALGTVLNAGLSQLLHVDFTPTDGVTYTTAGAAVAIDVNQITPVITWATPASITFGTALSAIQLNATTVPAGTFVYTPASSTVLNAGLNQTLHVDFSPTDTVNFTAASADVTIDVLQVSSVITWTNPASITYGTALSATQLNAAANVPGSFVYTPALGTVLNAATNQALHVDFTPTDGVNYTTASANAAIDVLQASPVITWANPATITFGTALSATQLNATANVPGSFVYTPASSTVLNAGLNQALHVAFTPTDGVNYTTASANAAIDVLQATQTITFGLLANKTVPETPVSGERRAQARPSRCSSRRPPRPSAPPAASTARRSPCSSSEPAPCRPTRPATATGARRSPWPTASSSAWHRRRPRSPTRPRCRARRPSSARPTR